MVIFHSYVNVWERVPNDQALLTMFSSHDAMLFIANIAISVR